MDENLKLNLFIIGYDFSLWAFWNSSSHSRMCTSKISNELSKFLRKIFSNTKFFLQFWMCISKILNELSKFHRQIFSNFNSRMCISNMLNEQIFSSIFLILPPILEDFEWNIVKYLLILSPIVECVFQRFQMNFLGEIFPAAPSSLHNWSWRKLPHW